MKKVRMICADCGSKNVRRDAWASWNEEKQDWQLHNVFDDVFCEDCNDLSGIEQEEVNETVL